MTVSFGSILVRILAVHLRQVNVSSLLDIGFVGILDVVPSRSGALSVDSRIGAYKTILMRIVSNVILDAL